MTSTLILPGQPLPGVYPWIPDQGDGTYRNPILLADYSDPDVVAHGDDFYLIASSFNCTPALPILHSRDLVNWTLINHAVTNLPHPRYAQVQNGGGVWAPAIRYHAGKFWIFFPLPDEGIYMTTADHPAGQWSPPHLVQAGNGLIDPCPLWADDGKAYLVHAFAESRCGIKHRLRVCPMAPDGSRLLGEGHIVFDDPKRQPTLEGPKFLKRDGWYYILAPAGGVPIGWQLALRSRNIYGPYEAKKVLEQGSTAINGPHQGALVETSMGEWWFLHFQDAGVYGRITHLQPAGWREGWPVMGVDYDGNGIGEPVTHHRKPGAGEVVPVAFPPTSDTFEANELGRQWQWNANHQESWYSLEARQGYLRLFAQPVPENDLSLAPHLLLQKFPARVFTVETAVEFPPSEDPAERQAGLVVMGRAHAMLGIAHSKEGRRHIFLQVNNSVATTQEIGAGRVRLRVDVQEGGVCRFRYALSVGEDWVTFGEPFQAREGDWIGARVGLCCNLLGPSVSEGYADFEYFEFLPPEQLD